MKKFFFSLAVFLIASFVFALTFQNVQAAQVGNIWVDAERNQIWGRGWMTGANLLVTVGEDEFPIAASEEGDFVIDFGLSGYTIKAGDVVTTTHAGNTVTNTVKPNLSFDFTQEEFETKYQGEISNTITGTAPANSKVVLWLSYLQWGDQGPTRYFDEVVEVTTDGSGKWTHTFTSQEGEPNPFEWKDINAFLFYDEKGDNVTLESIKGDKSDWKDVIWDPNATFARRTSDPGGFILTVYPQINTIWGADWPYGELVITVDRGTQKFTYNYGTHTGGSFRIHYDDHRINLQTGDVVTATIGELSMEHKVIDLKITSADTVKNIISGTTDYIVTDPEQDNYITVLLSAEHGGFGTTRTIEPDTNGKWIADFSVPQPCVYSIGTIHPVADITSETKFWVSQAGDPVEIGGKQAEHTWTQTAITNRENLIDLVRSFIVTRMAEFAALKTNISAVLDDPSQKLIFESPNFGKVEFSSFDIDTLLVINPEFLENMQDFVNISFNSEDNTLRSKVDTTALEFLSGHEAVIYFFNVAEKLGVTELTAENVRDYINIKVYDEGELVTDISDYFDWDNVTYDAETDILTLPVNHFTEYVLGEASELPETGAAIIYVVSLGLACVLTYTLVKKYMLKKEKNVQN